MAILLDEFTKLIAAAEDDVVDDYLAGRLTAEEVKQFEAYFLAAPARQRKLEFHRNRTGDTFLTFANSRRDKSRSQPHRGLN